MILNIDLVILQRLIVILRILTPEKPQAACFLQQKLILIYSKHALLICAGHASLLAWFLWPLPTLIFSNDKQQRAHLEGHQSYEHMVDIIMALNPRLKKLSYSKDPIALFRLFHTMTIHEFTFLTELDRTQALKEIDRLIKKDLIVQIDSPAGALWARSLKLEHLFS